MTVRASFKVYAPCALVAALACGGRRDTIKRDTATAAPAGAAVDTLHRASVPGVPATPPESIPRATARADTDSLLIEPARPQRGGAIFALARGVVTELPQCTWKGDPTPCFRGAGGVRVMIPLPAEDSAGTFTLTVARPAGRITHQIAVVDRDFGRDSIYLDAARYALVTRRAAIARDARALRQILSTVSPVQRWKGAWKDPVQGTRVGDYGVARYYFRASDSARALTLGPDTTPPGPFATDTSPRRRSEVPAWRHSGVDIAAPHGTPVRAPAAGVVSDVGHYVLSGRTLIIDHGQGVQSAYFHLDTILVHEGEVVRAGELLGRVGSSGLTLVPALHYGIYLNGRDIDPDVMRALPRWVRGDSVDVGPRRQR